LKTLVAEDDEDIANLHKLVLESRGHRVVLAPDGQKCVDIYRKTQGKFDAVVLDYKMPILNGIQVAREIFKQNPEQRIIIATGQAKETLSDCLKELGRVVEITEKPFEPELLAKVIEDTSASARVQELNELTRLTRDARRPPAASQIDKLLQQLKNIQKQGAI
jgi:CheY-like chemotaxis protein